MINLQIERHFFEAMMGEFPALAHLREQLRFGDRVDIGFAQLSGEQCQWLEARYRAAGPDWELRAAQIATLRQALDRSRVRFGPNDLETVLPAMIRYLLEDAIRGWVFTATVSGRPLPYVITRLDFTPANNEETGKIFIELKANAKGAVTTNTVRNHRERHRRHDDRRDFRAQGVHEGNPGPDRRL